MRTGRSRIAWACAIAIAALWLVKPSVSHAQDVTLSSPDGALSFGGRLLGFDGKYYRIESEFGELTIDGARVGCQGPGCPDPTKYVARLRFSGASRMGKVLLPALVEGFAMRSGYQARRETLGTDRFDYVLSDPDTDGTVARFGFRRTSTDEGFADLLADEADVVMALREIRVDERDRARDAAMGDLSGRNRSRVLALDAAVAIVAPRNPVRRISPQDLAGVISGQISDWSELGGPDAPIALHLPPTRSGLMQSVSDRLLAPFGAVASTQAERHERIADLAQAVITDPLAIGLTSFAEAGLSRALTLAGACGFSLSANVRSIKTEDYPLTAPMFLYLPARRLPKIAREFLTYTRSPAAQIVVRRSGFVDQAPDEIPLGAQGDRLANAIDAAGTEIALSQLQGMVRRLGTMARLTTTFRFESGSSRLDAQSRSNVLHLARALKDGSFAARELLFVGFSDGQGPAAANRAIAQSRSEVVRDAVTGIATGTNTDQPRTNVAAFGEALPMACDDSDLGRQVNRRVEVWVR